MSNTATHLVPAAKVVAVFGSSFLAGLIGACSYVAIPPILEAPADLLARQWVRLFNIGKVTAPPFAVTSCLCFGFLASQSTRIAGRFPGSSFDPTAPAVLYGAAALVIPTIVPYTLLAMQPTNDSIAARAAKAGDISDAQLKALVVKWSGMNYTRALLVSIGALLGTTAALT